MNLDAEDFTLICSTVEKIVTSGNREAVLETIVESPRYRKLPETLRVLELRHNCKLEMSIVKKIWREIITFKFEGKFSDMSALQKDLKFILEG